MKFAIATAAFFLLLGTTGSAYAQHGESQGGHSEGEHSQAGHSQSARPAQQHAARPQQRATPARQQQAKPAQHSQQAARTQPQHSNSANHSRNANQGHSSASRQHEQNARENHGSRNVGSHGRISNARYQSNFGRGHSFHVNRGDYDHRRFQYGGYSWGFVDPWPVAWGYSDDVYVVYADGGYFMYNRFHPGMRISINIF